MEDGGWRLLPRGSFSIFNPPSSIFSKYSSASGFKSRSGTSGIWCRHGNASSTRTMHFVDFFEPAEVALHAIPSPRPLVVFVNPIILVAVDDPALMFGGKLVERRPSGRRGLCKTFQVCL